MTALQTLIDRHFFEDHALELASDIMASLMDAKRIKKDLFVAKNNVLLIRLSKSHWKYHLLSLLLPLQNLIVKKGIKYGQPPRFRQVNKLLEQ